MREIGSEFWDVPVTEAPNDLFPEGTSWYLSGRSALSAILKEAGGKTAALPSWCCDSMIRPFSDAGMEVSFYAPGRIRTDCDTLLIMDYFGYTGEAPDLTGYTGTVIRDVTHSLFSRTCEDADYTFGSLRKWCGVYTGGFARARDGRPLEKGEEDTSGYTALRQRAMEEKVRYLAGEGDKSYLTIFAEAEDLLEEAGISPAAERDIALAKTLDVPFIRQRRRENAELLREAFPDWLLFPEMRETDCPLFVPVRVPEGQRDALRSYLIQREIYCPVHWPVSGYHRLTEEERSLYDEELSLVCDQRYGREDMERIIAAVRSFWEERG